MSVLVFVLNAVLSKNNWEKAREMAQQVEVQRTQIRFPALVSGGSQLPVAPAYRGSEDLTHTCTYPPISYVHNQKKN